VVLFNGTAVTGMPARTVSTNCAATALRSCRRIRRRRSIPGIRIGAQLAEPVVAQSPRRARADGGDPRAGRLARGCRLPAPLPASAFRGPAAAHLYRHGARLRSRSSGAGRADHRLDVTTQEQILYLLNQVRLRIGLAMLYVTHDLALLSQIADRIGVM